MALVPMIPLADAARLAGITSRTLRIWLRTDLGISFAPKRGAKRLIRQSDLEAVIRLHSGQQDWTSLRMEKGKLR